MIEIKDWQSVFLYSELASTSIVVTKLILSVGIMYRLENPRRNYMDFCDETMFQCVINNGEWELIGEVSEGRED